MKLAEKQLSTLRKQRKRATDLAQRRAIEAQMKLVMEPMTALKYKEFVAVSSRVNLTVLAELINGTADYVGGHRINGADQLFGRLKALVDDIRAAGVEQRPRLRLVRE